MACPFCTRSANLQDRMFYENRSNGWFAFQSAPPHTTGHAVLAALGRGGSCPRDFDSQTLQGLGEALCDVVAAIREHHAPHIENVLFASFRVQVNHFHLHLLPLWPEEEKAWREATGYRDSHLMEFIGSLEKKRAALIAERAAREASRKKRSAWKARRGWRVRSARSGRLQITARPSEGAFTSPLWRILGSSLPGSRPA